MTPIQPPLFDAINSCRWLFLQKLWEPVDNELRLVVAEGRADGPAEDFEIMPGKVITDSRSVEVTPASRVFELGWPSYVAYSVRNESFCTDDESEVWEGRLLCVYSRSHFIDYVARSTFASDDHPGPLRHYGLNCLNHIVDVVSAEPPVARLTDMGGSEPRGGGSRAPGV